MRWRLKPAATPQSNLRFASSPAGEPLTPSNSYVKPPSLREVDRLSYEVQQWKKDSMGTRV